MRAWKMPLSRQPPRNGIDEPTRRRCHICVPGRTGARSSPRARSCAARRRTPGRSSIPARRCSSSTRLRRQRRPNRSSPRLLVFVSAQACTTRGTRSRCALRCRRLSLKSLVVAAAARRGRRDVGDERRRGKERTPRVGRCPGRGIANARQRLVALDRRHQVIRLVADIPDVGRHRASVSRYSTNTFHCWVNCGRRFGIPGANLAGRLVERPELGEAGGQRSRPGRHVIVHGGLEEEAAD